MTQDAPSDFRATMLAVLGHAPETIDAGRLQRFSTNGKRGDTSGWSKLFDDRRAGVYGCWRLGISEVWTAIAPERMTPAERAALRRQVAEAKAEREREQAAAWRRNADRIEFLRRQLRPVTAGDPVHAYLCRRLALDDFPVPTGIRFHAAMPYVHEGAVVGTWPAMVAAVVVQGRTVALHRTHLTSDGRKADVPGPVRKLTPAAGLLRGASIRLHEPAAGLVGIAEGIETSLAASYASGVPTVAAYSAGNLAVWQWPAGVRQVVIFGDADKAGREAATALQARVVRAGLQASVLMPATEGADWLDVWAGAAEATA